MPIKFIQDRMIDIFKNKMQSFLALKDFQQIYKVWMLQNLQCYNNLSLSQHTFNFTQEHSILLTQLKW